MSVLEVTCQTIHGGYTLSLMGSAGKPKFVHINNHKTNQDSVLVPLWAIEQLLASTDNQKTCPKCGSNLIPLSSIDKEICSGCRSEFTWELDEGQESVLVEGKVGGRE